MLRERMWSPEQWLGTTNLDMLMLNSFSFSTSQTGIEMRTGQNFEMQLRRFKDTTGTYNMVSIIGFENYAELMGKLGRFIELKISFK